MTVDLDPTVRGNLLLSQLAVHERNAIHRAADAVAVTPGESLLRGGSQSAYVFFPTNCVVSVMRALRDGNAMELALIGNEGIVGLDVFSGARAQLDDAVVQSAGYAYRIPAEELRNQLRRGGGLQRALLRFMYALSAQVAQTALCSRFHPAEARLARWLMLISDRTSSLELRVQPQSVAAMLVVEPAAVTAAMQRLRARGAIAVAAEAVTIRDREILEVSACECYETLREEYERTLAS